MKASAAKNEALVRKILKGKKLRCNAFEAVIKNERVAFDGVWTVLKPTEVSKWIAGYTWAKGQEDCMKRELTYLAGNGADDPGIARWFLLAPQTKTVTRTWVMGSKTFAVKTRSRVDDRGERFKVYTEPDHRKVAEVLAGLKDGSQMSPVVKKNVRDKTGVLLFYPVKDESDSFDSMGFAILLPNNGRPKELRYGAVDDAESIS